MVGMDCDVLEDSMVECGSLNECEYWLGPRLIGALNLKATNVE